MSCLIKGFARLIDNSEIFLRRKAFKNLNLKLLLLLLGLFIIEVFVNAIFKYVKNQQNVSDF